MKPVSIEGLFHELDSEIAVAEQLTGYKLSVIRYLVRCIRRELVIEETEVVTKELPEYIEVDNGE